MYFSYGFVVVTGRPFQCPDRVLEWSARGPRIEFRSGHMDPIHCDIWGPSAQAAISKMSKRSCLVRSDMVPSRFDD